MQGRPGIIDRHASPEARRTVQGNGAYPLGIEMLIDFKQDRMTMVGDLERLVERWQISGFNVDHRTVDGFNFTNRRRRDRCGGNRGGLWRD